jgi:phage terminase large subunit-like protein
VPVTEVDTAVAAIFRRYTVVGFFADPAKWETFIAAWEAKYQSNLKVKATRDHPIEWWMTGGRSGLIVRALEQFRSAVIDGDVTHDGSYALTRHVLNARRRSSRSGTQIAKEHPESVNKIDAAVAAVLAWQARLAAIAAGVGRQPQFVPRRVR